MTSILSLLCGSFIKMLNQRSWITLYAFFYSIIKSSLNRWDSVDLDVILINEDTLFKKQQKPYFFVSAWYAKNIHYKKTEI